MARAAKRAKTGGGGPQRAGELRSAATVRSIRFSELSEPVRTQGPGSPEKKADVMEVHVDSKHLMFDFMSAAGSVLLIDFFHPGPQTLVKLNGLVDVLSDSMAECEDAASRKEISKAKKILKNYIKQFENLYYFEASLEEMVISLNTFFLDFGDKMQADVSDIISQAPRGQFA